MVSGHGTTLDAATAPMPAPLRQPCARNGGVMEEAPFSEVIRGNLAAVEGRIEAAARAAGRPAGSVTLGAVSKPHPADSVRAALQAAQLAFGDNRVQAARGQVPALP